MTSWKRWLGYAKAKLDDTVADGNAELDRLEAEQRAEAADKPWLRSEGDALSVEEVKAKIEHRAKGAVAPAAPEGAAGPPPPASAGEAPDPTAIDFEAQEREAKARLEGIRKELGLDGPAGAPEGPTDGGPPPGR